MDICQLHGSRGARFGDAAKGSADAGAQIAAVQAGLGVTTLPCFVGDSDPLLVRAPGAPTHTYGAIWFLTQGETRKTKRVRLFTEFISRRLAEYASLLAGLSVSDDERAAASAGHLSEAAV